ncbi:MAG TPA: hypothetical protein VMZ28_27825 [Kofleriaceae bacterium]|nr:hypothetical protein [Kofleriaceae bacterium]
MTDATTPDVNALLDEARIPMAVKAASVALAAAGLVVALLGVQNLTLVRWSGSYVFVPVALLVFGAIGIGVAAKLVRGRAWSLPAAIATAASLTLSAVGFFVLSAMAGLFTALSVLSAGAAVTALVLTLIAVGPFRQLVDTRRRLREAGYDLDL